MSEKAWLDLKIRMRPDIQWSRLVSNSETTWAARDPVSLQFFHFSALEKSIASRLDGDTKLSDVLSAVQQFRISEQWLLRLVSKLESACLTVPRSAGKSGRQLWLARNKLERKSTLHFLASPLAVRIKLVDPTRLLEFLTPVARVLFSKPFFLLAMVFFFVIGTKVLVMLLRDPGSLASSFADMTGQDAAVLVLVYLCVKSLHELGHALACRKWGSECHEIGVFFLVFMPCLYCDTTDCWKLTAWRRACIAAAGIYVELLIAAGAGLLWLLSPTTGELHLLAANTMVICSVSTVLVNANPLLRYDGYYVFSDLWGVPNLHEQSREAWRSMLVAWLTGSPLKRDRWDANPWLLAWYGSAAWVYRHFVVLVIAWVAWKLMDDIGLRLVGGLLVLLTLSSLLLGFVVGIVQLLRELIMYGEIRVFRAAFFLMLLLSAAIAFFYAPLPTFVTARGYATYANMNAVYAGQAGTLSEFAASGASVAKGTQIATLISPQLELRLIETRGEVAALEQRLEHLNILSVDFDSAYTELATVTELLTEAKDRLAIQEAECESLRILAESEGILMPVRQRSAPTLTERPDRSGRQSVLISNKLGCFIDRGTQLGWVCEPQAFRIRALVAEHDAQLLRIGMPVRCRWECDLGNIWHGSVAEVAPEPVDEMAEALIGDQGIAFEFDADGKAKPVQPHYEVTIDLQSWPCGLAYQNLATVHFDIPDRTLHQSLVQFFDRNLRLEL